METNIAETQKEKNIEQNKKNKTKMGHKAKRKSINTRRWAVRMFFLTLAISFCFSVLCEILLNSTKSVFGAIVSVLLLFIFIAVAVVGDTIGLAVASSKPEPFTAMASQKINGAKESLFFLKNADKVSSLFCDIVGDACSIICGSIGAYIIGLIAINGEVWQVLVASLMSALIAALTVFGKALGKNMAINNSTEIVLAVGKLVKLFKIKKEKRRAKRKSRRQKLSDANAEKNKK